MRVISEIYCTMYMFPVACCESNHLINFAVLSGNGKTFFSRNFMVIARVHARPLLSTPSFLIVQYTTFKNLFNKALNV